MDVVVGQILEGGTVGLSEDGSAVGTSVTGYVGAQEGIYVGLLLGDSEGMVLGTAVTGYAGAADGSTLGQSLGRNDGI